MGNSSIRRPRIPRFLGPLPIFNVGSHGEALSESQGSIRAALRRRALRSRVNQGARGILTKVSVNLQNHSRFANVNEAQRYAI